MQSDWLEESHELSSSGKTCQASSLIQPAHSVACSAGLRARLTPFLLKNGRVVAWSMEKADEFRGPCSTLNFSEYHNAGAECSHLPALPCLADILETGRIQDKYYLSARACAGILRRAEKRGKQLPPALRIALEAVVSTPARTVQDEERP